MKKGKADHREQRVVVKAAPGPTFKVVKTKFFFELLVHLFAGPTGLYRRRYLAPCGARISDLQRVWKKGGN